MLKTKICVFLGFLILLIPSFVFAFDFDKDYLLSDSELYSCNLKTESQVQRFLNSENSCLANYTVDEDKAAGVIAGAAKEYEVSTCWILTTLQQN